MPTSKRKATNTNATAAEAVRTAPAAGGILLSVAEAERVYELYRNIEAADAMFKTCQSVSFRQHMQSVYKSANVSAAFDALKARIDQAKEEAP